MRFIATFDRIGLILSLTAILILLYVGLLTPGLARDLWVAYAFWMAGFFGSLLFGFTRRDKLRFGTIVLVVIFIALILAAFFAINTAYSVALSGETMVTERLLSFAVGVSEELFFGIFILGLLINWVGFNPVLAIVLSAAGHAAYHIPNWGGDPFLLSLFFISFMVARAVYVFAAPYVGVLVGAHGFWNLGVNPSEVFKKWLFGLA